MKGKDEVCSWDEMDLSLLAFASIMQGLMLVVDSPVVGAVSKKVLVVQLRSNKSSERM